MALGLVCLVAAAFIGSEYLTDYYADGPPPPPPWHIQKSRVGRNTSGRPTIAATLSGRVTRKADGAPIAGAIVTLSAPDEGHRGAAPVRWIRTDADGRWSFMLHTSGSYEVTANAVGYVPQSRSKVRVSPPERLDDLDFALAEGGVVVEGVVTNSNGGALHRALVIARADGRTTAFTAVTDANGRYALALADSVAYQLEASHRDYASEWKNVKASQKTVVDFSLVQGATVRGRVVVRGTGEPVADALVSFGGPTETRADDQGEFVFRNLPAMMCAFDAHAPGYSTRKSTSVLVTPGQVVEGIELEVDPAFSISGRVIQKGEHGIGVEGVEVTATPTHPPFMFVSASTDASGAFQLVGLRPGEYSLIGHNEGHMAALDKTVTIADKDVDDVTLEIDVGVTISGRIEPATAATVGLQFDMFDGQDNPSRDYRAGKARVQTDPSGAFSMESIPNGEYDIVAVTTDGRGGRLPIVVAGTAQSGLVVTVTKLSTISGRVVDANGKPKGNYSVFARALYRKAEMKWPSVVSSPFARSAADGSFKISGLEAGDYVVAPNFGDGPYVHVDAKTDIRDLELVVPARDGVITGQVVETNGKPVSHAFVFAAREEGTAGYSDLGGRPVQTDNAGRFTVPNLVDGTYTVSAEYPRGGPHGMRKGIRVGQSTTVTLEARGSLTVDVMQNGVRVTKASISCGSPISMSGDDEHDVVPPVTFRALPAGDYDCEVSADGGAGKLNATVRSGNETKLAVDLPGWASLTGTVVSAITNKPLAGVSVSAGGESSTTDAKGQFVLERVPSGSQSALFSVRRPGFGALEYDSYPYTASPGQRVDMGTVKVVMPVSDAPGTLGLIVAERGGALVVANVQSGGPAANAGIQVGDTIVSIDGRDVSESSPRVAMRVFAGGAVSNGQTVTVGLARNVSVKVTAVAWN